MDVGAGNEMINVWSGATERFAAIKAMIIGIAFQDFQVALEVIALGDGFNGGNQVGWNRIVFGQKLSPFVVVEPKDYLVVALQEAIDRRVEFKILPCGGEFV
jgi:hypothetical protein